jgi:hypothetical protein
MVTIVVLSDRKRSFIFMGYCGKPDPPSPLVKGGQEEERKKKKEGELKVALFKVPLYKGDLGGSGMCNHSTESNLPSESIEAPDFPCQKYRL